VAIRTFADKGTEDIANARNSKAARNVLPANLHRLALEKLILLDAATRLDDLSAWPSLRLEKLKGNRADQYSIRINNRFRICFAWKQSDAFDVEIVDYH
jgi:proteic killer suppression protein